MTMRVQTFAADPTKPPTGHHSDADMRALLASAAQALLAAEATLRVSTERFEMLVTSCRAHGQAALAAEASKNLQDRRPA